MERFDRQRKVLGFGAAADRRLSELRVLLVGVGGIGATLAEGLTRAGVGELTLLDPDCVDTSNLARQMLFTAADARRGRPKVEAALASLAEIGGRTTLSGRAEALTPRNAPAEVSAVDLVFDATDHLPARALIDRVCRDQDRPWIHTAAIEDRFTVIPFLSPGPPCFRCYVPELPPPGALGTCESLGVLPVTTGLAAVHGLSALWGWLADPRRGDRNVRTIVRGRVGRAEVRSSVLRPDPACPACQGNARSQALDAVRPLCGQNRVEAWIELDAEEAHRRLGRRAPGWTGEERAGILRAQSGEERLTVFPDGRLLLGPGSDADAARRRLVELLGEDVLAQGSP